MDVFKLAFETTIVGLLTFVWLGVATYLLFPEFLDDLIKQKIPDLVKNYQAGTAVAVLTIMAYCFGSAILPIANQMVNDEHWPLNENAIRCQVFTKQEHQLKNINVDALPRGKGFSLRELEPRHCSYWAPIFTEEDIGMGERIRRLPRLWLGFPARTGETRSEEKDEALEAICSKAKTTECDEFKARKILAIFQQQEIAVLNQGSDKTERLRQLHERIVVLRGAVFSGFVLFLIYLFAYFARVNGSTSHWIRPFFGVLLAVLLTVFAGFNGYRDLINRNIFDTPVLESLLVVITIFGVVLVVRRAKTPRFLTKRYVLVALFFTGLTYGGWMWSEIIYDQQVISSFALLQGDVETQKQAPRP